MTRQNVAKIVGSVLLLAVGGFVGWFVRPVNKGDSGNIWRDVLSRCANGEQTKNVMYFSLSNNRGPGTIWKDSPENGYILVRSFDSTLPKASAVINRGAVSSCIGVHAEGSTAKGDVGVKRLFSVLPGNVSGELKQARTVDITVDGWAWDQISEGDFRDMLNVLAEEDPPNAYLTDLPRPGYRVTGRALRTNGITADLNFADSAAAQLRAKYPGGLKLAGKLDGSWQGSTSLRLKLAEPAYVAVQLWEWKSGGLGLQNKGQFVRDTL